MKLRILTKVEKVSLENLFKNLFFLWTKKTFIKKIFLIKIVLIFFINNLSTNILNTFRRLFFKNDQNIYWSFLGSVCFVETS